MTVTGWGGNTSFTVEIDLSQSTSVGDWTPDPDAPLWLWDSGKWDDTLSVWQAGTTWTDVTAHVRSFNCSASFERQNQAFNASTAGFILDNRSGDYSPDNTASPYRVGGVTTIGMWRKVRVSGSYSPPSSPGTQVAFPIFAGYVRAWNEDFPEYGMDAVVSVDCVDAFAKLAAYDGFEQDPAGAGELSGARIARILDNAGLDDANRTIDAGTVTMQATTLAGNALTELKLVADSEGGAIWCGPDGGIYFDSQYALIEKVRSNTLSVDFGNGDGQVAFNSISTSYDGDLVVNMVSFQRVGGAVQTTISPASRAIYGDRQQTRTDLICESDAQALKLARQSLATNQQAERRVESLTFKPYGQPTEASDLTANLALSGGLTLRCLARVSLAIPNGDPLIRMVYVQGVSHTITPDDWTVGVQFSSATPYIGYFGSIWDTGLWGTASWAW
jgi:hypothetical protein